MSIRRLYDTEFTTKRQQWTIEEVNGQPIDKAEEESVGTFMGHLQQTTAEYVQTLGLTMTIPFALWCDLSTDIKEGDVLESERGTFTVRAVQRMENGRNAHIEAIVQMVETSTVDLQS